MKITMTAVGNLTKDPELRFTAAGKAVANLVIACSDRKFDRDTNTYIDGNAVFLTCTVWGKMAENCAESLQKGMQVVAVGVLRQHEFEDKQGAQQRRMELEVDNIGPSLANAVAKVEKVKRDSLPVSVDPWASANAEEPPF
jgi:single-strand DNA-binding protein